MIPKDKMGISGLRGLDSQSLRELREPLLIRRDEEPLAVLVPYDLFLEWQNTVESVRQIPVPGDTRFSGELKANVWPYSLVRPS